MYLKIINLLNSVFFFIFFFSFTPLANSFCQFTLLYFFLIGNQTRQNKSSLVFCLIFQYKYLKYLNQDTFAVETN